VKFNLERITVDVELPTSINDCDQRLEVLKEEYKLLQDTRSNYKTYKEYWGAIGKKIQQLNGEIQILNSWKAQMNQLLDKELGKKTIGSNNLALSTPDGIISGLYAIIQHRLSHERPIKLDEKPVMLAAMSWLRQSRSIELASKIEPEALGNKAPAKHSKTKKPRR